MKRDSDDYLSPLDGVPLRLELDAESSIAHIDLGLVVLDSELASELVNLAGFLNVAQVWAVCAAADFDDPLLQKLQANASLVVVIDLDGRETVAALLGEFFDDDSFDEGLEDDS